MIIDNLDSNLKFRLFNDLKKIWDDHKLSIDLPLIDLQHMWVIFLSLVIERNYKLNDIEDKKESLYEIIEESERYSQSHFILEEVLLNLIGEETGKHIKEHKAYLKVLSGEINVFKSYVEVDIRLVNSMSRSLHHYLRDWWLGHIAISDTNYRRALNKSAEKDIILQQWKKEIIEKNLLTILTIQKELYEFVTGLTLKI